MPSVKPGVSFWPGMHSRVEEVLPEVDRIFVRIAGREAIITSARDSKHSERSLHYEGKALDFRSRDLKPAVAQRVLSALRSALGTDFDVILESDHFHLEYDPE